MQKINIIVCCHKQDPNIRTDYPYVPIHGGKALHPEPDLCFIGDDSGDNISGKNSEWCELTPLYWAWKNFPGTEYFGLAHYRRYLALEANDSNIDSLMEGVDMLVAKPTVLPYNLATYIQLLSSREFFWIFADTLVRMHPDAGDTLIDYFFNSNAFHPHQIFICRRELMDQYCSFLMPVLEETEKRLLESPYSRQRRAIAYIGELMLGFFIAMRQLKVREVEEDIMYDAKPVSGHRTFKNALQRKLYFTSEKIMKNLFFRFFQTVPHDSFIVADEDIILWLKRDGIKLDVLDKPLYYSK